MIRAASVQQQLTAEAKCKHWPAISKRLLSPELFGTGEKSELHVAKSTFAFWKGQVSTLLSTGIAIVTDAPCTSAEVFQHVYALHMEFFSFFFTRAKH